MLPAGARLRHRDDLTTTLRRGRRASGSSSALVVHLLVPPMDAARQAVAPGCSSVRAGFVVGRSVGGAVVRNRVRRRLRHLVATRLSLLPAGAQLVVRALPRSATASSAELVADLDQALARVLAGARGRGPQRRLTRAEEPTCS